jgi:D-beta-D-heptose 7-phosphate kinase/D-beta-D-heptose 1-phosphate adenosyltransferase
VVANLASLGARPVVAGWIGRDAAGRTISGLLKELGADTSGLFTTAEVQSIEKTRILAHSQQVVRLDREARRPSPRLTKRLLDVVGKKLRGADAVLVSDYGKGAVSPALLDFLADRRESGNFAYLIDPKQPNFDSYRGATLVKPNEVEATAAAGLEIENTKSLGVAGRKLLDRWQSEAVMISRGENGLSLFQRGASPRNFPAVAREVFDVTGAGDTVMAVASLSLAAGGTLEEAALLANLAAAIVVGKVGTATLEPKELLAAVRNARPRATTRRRKP